MLQDIFTDQHYSSIHYTRGFQIHSITLHRYSITTIIMVLCVTLNGNHRKGHE